MTELGSERHGLFHFLLVLVQMVHMVSKSLFSSDRCGYVLELLLN